MGRGYIAVALRRVMSANENESFVNTIKIDDDNLNNQPNPFTRVYTNDIDVKLRRKYIAMGKLLDKRNIIEYLPENEKTILMPDVNKKIDKLAEEQDKLLQEKKNEFFKYNPKINENSVKNISLKNLEDFGSWNRGFDWSWNYTIEERKIVKDEIEKRYRDGFVKQYPRLNKMENGNIEKYIPLFKKAWRKQNGFQD